MPQAVRAGFVRNLGVAPTLDVLLRTQFRRQSGVRGGKRVDRWRARAAWLLLEAGVLSQNAGSLWAGRVLRLAERVFHVRGAGRRAGLYRTILFHRVCRDR